MPSEKSDYAGQKRHIIWIDLVRSFAICSVILVHVLNRTGAFEVEYMLRAGLFTQIGAFVLFTIGRLGVPLFLFITGYLLLDRDYNREACVRFWKRNWGRLFLTIEIWIIIYNLFLTLYRNEAFDVITLLKNMFFIQSVDMSHVWYMEMILGLYIFIPFVAVVLQKFDWKLLRFPVIVIFAYIFLLPIVNIILRAFQKGTVESLPDLSFGGGIYGLMIILGYFCKKGVFRKIQKRYLYAIASVFFVCTVLLQLFAFRHGEKMDLWYDCGTLLIAAFCLFEIFSRKKTIHFSHICTNLARCSFGIYLIHFPVLLLVERFYSIELRPASLVTAFILILGISWILVNLISKIPVMGKILFYLK